MSVVYLHRLMSGVTASLLASAGAGNATVVWAPSDYPRPSAEPVILAAKLIGGPSGSPLGGEAVYEVELPTEALATFTGAGTVRLRAAGWYWEATGASATALRDAMLAAIAADPVPYVGATAVAVGAAQLRLTGTALGDLYHLGVSGPATFVATDSEPAVVQSGEVQSTIEVQAYSLTRHPYGGAADVLSAWLGKLLLPSQRDILDRYGLAVLGPRPGVVDLTTLSGPSWESRAAVRLSFGQIALSAEALLPIERIELGLNLSGDVPSPITVQIESEVA